MASGLWGISAVMEQKIVLKKFSSFQLLTYRAIILAAVSLVFFSSSKTLEHIKSLSRKDWGNFLLAYLAALVGMYLFFELLSRDSKSTAIAIVQPMLIVFATVISFFFFDERLKPIEIAGIFAVILGVILMNWDKIPGIN